MIVVVIPTYKEKETLKRNLPILNKLLKNKDRILLIDDTKNFETKRFESDKIKVFPRVRKKRGYGQSLKFGLMIATYILDADYVIQMDADHNPEDLRNVLRRKKKVIIGFEPKKRKLTRFVSKLLSRLLGIKCKQPTCGFRMFHKSVLRQLEWNKIKAKGFGIQIEVLYMVQRKRFKVAELLISPNERKYDKSKLGLRMIFSWLRTYRRLFTKHLYISFIDLIMGKKH